MTRCFKETIKVGEKYISILLLSCILNPFYSVKKSVTSSAFSIVSYHRLPFPFIQLLRCYKMYHNKALLTFFLIPRGPDNKHLLKGKVP